MRAVDDSALVPFLKTSGPLDRRKAAHNRFFAELDIRGPNGCDCYCGILFLVFTTQSYWRPVVSLIYELHWRTAFSGSRANDFFGLRLLRRRNDWHARFDNSCFFTGDLSQVVSKPHFMVETDRSNHRNIGLNSVGRIESATQARFKNRDIDFRVAKMF